MPEDLTNDSVFLYSIWVVGFLAAMVVLCLYLLLGNRLYKLFVGRSVREIADDAPIVNLLTNLHFQLEHLLGIFGLCIGFVCFVPIYLFYILCWPVFLILELAAMRGKAFYEEATGRSRWN